jgi:hypothetical protein
MTDTTPTPEDVVRLREECKQLADANAAAAGLAGGSFYKAGQVWRAQLFDAINRLAALAAAASPVSQDALDARRYRWLRDESEPGICAFYLSVGDAFKGVRFARETVDAAIDEQITRAASPLPEGE